MEFARWELDLTHATNSAFNRPAYDWDGISDIELEVGDWTLVARAFYADTDTEPMAIGTIPTFTVAPGENPETLYLDPAPGGYGTFELNIPAVSANVAAITVYLFKFESGYDLADVLDAVAAGDYFEREELDLDAGAATATLADLPAGRYLVLFELTSTGADDPITLDGGILRVYRNLTSTFADPDDMFANVAFRGDLLTMMAAAWDGTNFAGMGIDHRHFTQILGIVGVDQANVEGVIIRFRTRYPAAYADNFPSGIYGLRDLVDVALIELAAASAGPLSTSTEDHADRAAALNAALAFTRNPLRLPADVSYAWYDLDADWEEVGDRLTLTIGAYDVVIMFYGDMADRYEISLTGPSGTALPANFVFASAYLNATPPPALVVTVTNTGNQPTGDLLVELTGPAATSFTLTSYEIDGEDLEDAGDTVTFTVQPNAGLLVGTHTATVTVGRADGVLTYPDSESFDVTFTVSYAPVATVDITVGGQDEDEITIDEGGYVVLAVTIGPPNADQSVTWSIVSGEDYVEIYEDDLTASTITVIGIAGGGSAVIRATATGRYAEVTVNVAAEEPRFTFELPQGHTEVFRMDGTVGLQTAGSTLTANARGEVAVVATESWGGADIMVAGTGIAAGDHVHIRLRPTGDEQQHLFVRHANSTGWTGAVLAEWHNLASGEAFSRNFVVPADQLGIAGYGPNALRIQRNSDAPTFDIIDILVSRPARAPIEGELGNFFVLYNFTADWQDTEIREGTNLAAGTGPLSPDSGATLTWVERNDSLSLSGSIGNWHGIGIYTSMFDEGDTITVTGAVAVSAAAPANGNRQMQMAVTGAWYTITGVEPNSAQFNFHGHGAGTHSFTLAMVVTPMVLERERVQVRINDTTVNVTGIFFDSITVTRAAGPDWDDPVMWTFTRDDAIRAGLTQNTPGTTDTAGGGTVNFFALPANAATHWGEGLFLLTAGQTREIRPHQNAGVFQAGGANLLDIVRLEGVDGPFRIQAVFSSTGGQDDRYLSVRIGMDGTPTRFVQYTDGTTMVTSNVLELVGDGSPIYLVQSDALRIQQVTLTPVEDGFTPPNRPLVGITIESNFSLYAGNPARLITRTFNPADTTGDRSITWSFVSDPADGVIQLVPEAGFVTPVGVGTATITATPTAGAPQTVVVTVSDPDFPITGVTITGADNVLVWNDTAGWGQVRLAATAEPALGTNPAPYFTWEILGTSVGGATIVGSDTGAFVLLRGISPGVVNVRATSIGLDADGDPISADHEVTVLASVPFPVTLNFGPNTPAGTAMLVAGIPSGTSGDAVATHPHINATVDGVTFRFGVANAADFPGDVAANAGWAWSNASSGPATGFITTGGATRTNIIRMPAFDRDVVVTVLYSNTGAAASSDNRTATINGQPGTATSVAPGSAAPRTREMTITAGTPIAIGSIQSIRILSVTVDIAVPPSAGITFEWDLIRDLPGNVAVEGGNVRITDTLSIANLPSGATVEWLVGANLVGDATTLPVAALGPGLGVRFVTAVITYNGVAFSRLIRLNVTP